MSRPAAIETIRSDFIEKTGLITQGEGLPRIAGRVLGLLVFDGDIVSFGQLATQLQVSRASISTSVRLLEERGLVKRLTKPGERQDFFQLAPTPYAAMLEGTQKRTQATQADIMQIIAALPEGAEAAPRLASFLAFHASIATGLGVALDLIAGLDENAAAQQTAAMKDTTDV